MEASTCCVTIHHLLGRTLDGWGAGMWKKYVCIYTHMYIHTCMLFWVDVCRDNDVRDNHKLADQRSQACWHRGQKHAVRVCHKCVIISGCEGWESVIFKVLTIYTLGGGVVETYKEKETQNWPSFFFLIYTVPLTYWHVMFSARLHFSVCTLSFVLKLIWEKKDMSIPSKPQAIMTDSDSPPIALPLL